MERVPLKQTDRHHKSPGGDLCIRDRPQTGSDTSPGFIQPGLHHWRNVEPVCREDNVTNGAIVIHTQRLKSDPGGNLLS